MKKIFVLCFVLQFTFGFSQSYEWMESLEVAKRLALAQNKMLFVLWQDAALDFQLPQKIPNSKKIEWVSILDHETLSEVIWEHFVPVVISEEHYERLYSEIKGKRKTNYIERFNDDSVKILDAAGNILNVKLSYEGGWEGYFKVLVNRYGLDTFYINESLRNYTQNKNFESAFNLAQSYMEYAVINNKRVERELLDLALIYLEEARSIGNNGQAINKTMLMQKCKLLEIYPFAVRNRPKKILRELEEIEAKGISEENIYLHTSLKYTAYRLLGNSEVDVLKNKLSSLTLEKLERIINKHN